MPMVWDGSRPASICLQEPGSACAVMSAQWLFPLALLQDARVAPSGGITMSNEQTWIKREYMFQGRKPLHFLAQVFDLGADGKELRKVAEVSDLIKQG